MPAWVLPAMMAGGALMGGKQGKKPQTTNFNQTSSSSPWGPTQQPLNNIVDWAGQLFQNYWPAYPDAKPPGFHFGQQTNNVINQLLGNAQAGPSDLYKSGSDFIQNNLGQSNPLLSQVFGSAMNYRPDYLDQFIQQAGGSGFFGSSEPYMHNLLSQTAFGGGDNSGLFGMTGGYLQNILSQFFGPDGSAFKSGGLLSGTPAPTVVYKAGPTGGYGGGGAPMDADNPYLQQLEDAIRQEGEETYKRLVVPQVDSEYNRAGRYGSTAYQFAHARAFDDSNENVNNSVAQALSAAWENAQNRANALQIASMNSGSQAGAASAAAAAQQQAAQLGFLGNVLGLGVGADQFAGQLGGSVLGLLQGTDQFNAQSLLSGILGLDQSQQFGLGLGGQLAGLDQSYNLGLLNSIPGLEQSNQYGNNLLAGLLGPLVQGDMAQYNSGMAQWQNQFNQEQYNNQLPYGMLGQYLNTISPLAQMFGTTRTTGQNMQPGQGFLGGALQGALGMGMAGMGMGLGGGKGGAGAGLGGGGGFGGFPGMYGGIGGSGLAPGPLPGVGVPMGIGGLPWWAIQG